MPSPAPAAPAAPAPSPNFAFLAAHDARLVALTTQAEAVFPHDPVGCLVRLRAFAEHLARRAAANVALYVDARDALADLVARLLSRGAITPLQDRIFHDLRRAGNTAAHEGRGTHAEALHQLRMAREPPPRAPPPPAPPPPASAGAALASHEASRTAIYPFEACFRSSPGGSRRPTNERGSRNRKHPL